MRKKSSFVKFYLKPVDSHFDISVFIDKEYNDWRFVQFSTLLDTDFPVVGLPLYIDQ